MDDCPQQPQCLLGLLWIDNTVANAPLSTMPSEVFGILVVCTFATGLHGLLHVAEQHVDRARCYRQRIVIA